MGYARYGTPMGPAGYDVDDVCHEEGCSEAIDRGLDCLCGGVPGYADEFGCGRWFCGEHLFMAPAHIELAGGGLCGGCLSGHGDDE
jgi:hypothetical protein